MGNALCKLNSRDVIGSKKSYEQFYPLQKLFFAKNNLKLARKDYDILIHAFILKGNPLLTVSTVVTVVTVTTTMSEPEEHGGANNRSRVCRRTRRCGMKTFRLILIIRGLLALTW